jgi:hypothetical protein
MGTACRVHWFHSDGGVSMSDHPNDWLDADNANETEIRFLVENTDLSPIQAKELVQKHGTNREDLLEIARNMKAEG